jgi:hypothetical protein
MTKLSTVLRKYEFDISTPEGKSTWESFKAERKNGPHCFGPVFHEMQSSYALDGVTLDLEAGKNLFENQWNATDSGGKSYRVFDWFLQAHGHLGFSESSPSHIRRGHYLEQTPEMKEIRRNTNCCGYCGHKEEAHRGAVFCSSCLDSAYLKESDLHLLRMVSIEDSNNPRGRLTVAELAHLLPLYKSAQLHGTTERGKARITAQRVSLAADYNKAIHEAKTKRDGFLWLMDRGINTENVIYYAHTDKFSFGWRNPISAAVASELLDILPEFPFDYEIKRADDTPSPAKVKV